MMDELWGPRAPSAPPPDDGPPGPEPPPYGEEPTVERTPREAPRGTGPAGAGRAPGALQPAATIWTVAELTRAIRDAVRSDDRLRDVWVEGEVGQVSVSAAGHCFFALRDDRTQLSCVLFRQQRLASPFEPRTGLRIVARGRIDVYDAQGTYQLYVDSIQPAGFGDLALRFEALKARLAAEGLFDVARRRPLPPCPQVVGVVTSLGGAVLHDVHRVLARRWPLARLVVSPCQVQGDAAPASIVAALGRASRWQDPATGAGIEVLIIARGGGSLEDLWAFNDERVVRAVAACPIPVVSGVGHETDVTLVDFAADVRAPTPSAAAEVVVPSKAEATEQVRVLRARLAGAGDRRIAEQRRVLAAERRALGRLHPRAVLAGERQRAAALLERAERSVERRRSRARASLDRPADRLPFLAAAWLGRGRADLATSVSALAALSPYATLDRGYAIVARPDGRIARSALDQSPGDVLDVRLARGALDVRVEKVRDSAR
jgi:exodeoxyribonuclease VII large subunit